MDCKTLCEKLTSKDNEELREAAYQAGEQQCEEAVTLLVELLKNTNLGVQEAAEQALRKIPGAATVRAVIPLLESDEAPVRNLSMDILRQVGSRDLKALLELLENRDPDLRIFSADILGAVGDVAAVGPLCRMLLDDPEVNVRYQAAVSLGNLGSTKAAECLNKAMGDDEWVQFSVIEALIKIRDESSVDALVASLGKGSELVDSMIVEALGKMGNVKAVPMLLDTLDEANPALRNKMVQALVKLLGGQALALLSAEEKDKFRVYLTSALADEDQEVQDAAVQGLSHVGDAGATEHLLDIARTVDKDKHQERHDALVQALVAIGLNENLVAALREGDMEVAAVALEVMAAVGGRETFQVLMEVFWSKERDLQRDIATVLSDNAGPEAIDFFQDVLSRHEDGHVIKQALKYLGERHNVQQAADQVLSFLDHRFDDVKESALNASIHLANETVLHRFEDMFHSPEPLDRLMAVYAFGNLDANKYLDRLREALGDDVPDIRKIALEALGSVCTTTPEALSMLEICLHDENSEVRKALMEVLGNCRHPHAHEYLLDALSDEDDWVKIRALEALVEQGLEGPLDRLSALLDSPNKLVVLKSIEAIGRIGGKEGFNILLELSKVEDPEIQDAVEEALSILRNSIEERE